MQPAPLRYWKVPFELSGERLDLAAGTGNDGTWVDALGDPRLLLVIADVLAASVDPADIASVGALGPEAAARQLIDLAAEGAVHWREGWWELLLEGEVVAGFVLPVVFDGCRRGDLDEGTIFYVGVSPALRGKGFGRTLLRRATQRLTDHGVWRIYCDTAENNAPMLHLFETEGWERLEPHLRPI